MRLQPILDAENAQVSDATIARLHAIQEKDAAVQMKWAMPNVPARAALKMPKMCKKGTQKTVACEN
jgi:hypothetical protein